jgi:hypothetical protein
MAKEVRGLEVKDLTDTSILLKLFEIVAKSTLPICR